MIIPNEVDEFGYWIDRILAEAYARRKGYFWLPCLICGFERGGHESRQEFHIPIQGKEGLYQSVCARHPDAENEYILIPEHVEKINP